MDTVGGELSLLDAPVHLAFSGGRDSTVLLHLAARRLPREQLRAIHVNHGWSEHSNAWEDECRRRAADLGIKCRVVRVDAKPGAGESPEAVARAERYEAFRGVVGVKEILLTAHHQDDQALTVLLQLLRGAGPSGLSAMPQRAAFGRGFIVRPLLDVPARIIGDYARTHHLSWIEDGSNAQTRYDRNYLRLEIVPLLEARWPGWCKTLARSAAHQAELAEVLREGAAADCAACMSSRSGEAGGPAPLVRGELMGLGVPRRKQVLRCWFQRAGLGVPRITFIDRMLRELDKGTADGLLAQQGDAQVRIYRGHLYIVAGREPELPAEHDWPAGTDLALPGLGTTLLWRELVGQAPALERCASLSVRFRRGGERCRRVNRGGVFHQRLKKIFQQHGCPPWLRSCTPLIYADDRLRLIWGVAACD